MASAFDWGRFQLDAFQIDVPVLVPCDQDYVVSGYVEDGYICTVSVQVPSGGGKSKRKTRRTFVERDGQIYLFDSPAKAALWVQAQKSVDKPQETPKSAPAEPKKVKEVPTHQVIKYDVLKDVLGALQKEIDLSRMKQLEMWDEMLEIQKRVLWIEQDEEDIEMLLMAL